MRAHHWQPAVARFWRAALRGTHVRQHTLATLRSAASVTRRPLRVRRGLARRQLLASQLWSLPERRGSARQGHVDVVCTGPRPALRPARARRSPGGSIFRRSPSTRACVCDVKCVCVCVSAQGREPSARWVNVPPVLLLPHQRLRPAPLPGARLVPTATGTATVCGHSRAHCRAPGATPITPPGSRFRAQQDYGYIWFHSARYEKAESRSTHGAL